LKGGKAHETKMYPVRTITAPSPEIKKRTPLKYLMALSDVNGG